MRRIVALIASMLAFTPLQSAEEWSGFDIPAGKFLNLLTIPLEVNSGVSCRVRYSDVRFHGEWGPSFSIIFAEKGTLKRDDLEERTFKLSISATENDNSRLFSVDILGGKEPYSSVFLGLPGISAEHKLSLDWRDDGLFTYFAMSSDKEFGQGHIVTSILTPRQAIVAASGLKGEFVCGTYEI